MKSSKNEVFAFSQQLIHLADTFFFSAVQIATGCVVGVLILIAVIIIIVLVFRR